MNKLGLNGITFKRKGDRFRNRINNLLNNHKYIKIKVNETKNFK